MRVKRLDKFGQRANDDEALDGRKRSVHSWILRLEQHKCGQVLVAETYGRTQLGAAVVAVKVCLG
jgi:hypothetical protein